MASPYTLHILHEGYSRGDSTGMDANCTCSLITGPTNIIIDTMTPWDKDILVKGIIQFLNTLRTYVPVIRLLFNIATTLYLKA